MIEVIKKILGLIVPCILFVGCAVGPDFKKPLNPEVSSITRNDEGYLNPVESKSVKSQKIDKNWWFIYGSNELNSIVEMALRNNPTISAALANLKVAQENVRAQQGFFFPTVQAGVSMSRQGTGNTLSPAIATGNAPTVYNLNTAQLSLGFMPDVFGGNRRQVESLKAQADSQKYQLEALRTTIVTNVIAAVVQDASLSEQVELQKTVVTSIKKQLFHAKKMYEVGYYSAIDLSNQELIYSQSIQNLTQLRKQLDQNRDLLAVLCGQYPSQKISSIKLVNLQIPSALPDVIPSKLVNQRPDVKAAEEIIRANNAQIGVAVANMLPQFSIAASYGGAAGVLGNVFNSGNGFWSVAGGGSQTLFAGGTLYARKKAADAATDAAIEQYKSVVLAAFQNVADTLYALANDKESMDSAVEMEKSQSNIFDANTEQFNVGYQSEPGFLAAEQSFYQAKMMKAQALSVYLGDTLLLYQALGGGWVEEGQDN